MNLTDTLNMHGHIVIESVNINGKKEILLDEENLIVTSGRLAVANMLANTTNFVGVSIYDIAFGDQGVLTNNPAIALSINPSETSVIHRITGITQGVDYFFNIQATQTVSPKIVSSITVPTISGLNGIGLSELALMLQTGPTNQPGYAFSIKRFPSILKSDTISLIITWTIYL